MWGRGYGRTEGSCPGKRQGADILDTFTNKPASEKEQVMDTLGRKHEIGSKSEAPTHRGSGASGLRKSWQNGGPAQGRRPHCTQPFAVRTGPGAQVRRGQVWNRPGEALTDWGEAPSQKSLRVPPGEQAQLRTCWNAPQPQGASGSRLHLGPASSSPRAASPDPPLRGSSPLSVGRDGSRG